MLIQKGFKYRLYPTDEQRQNLLQQGGNARFIWNLFLVQNCLYYRETGKFIFYHELAVSLPKLKQQYPFLLESFSQSLQMVARQFDRALKDSFKKQKGFPSFKKKSLFTDSFSCPQKWRLGKGFIFIPKIGEVPWKKHRALKGKPKSITISQDGNNWYCSVLCEYTIKDKEKQKDNIIGIDVGLKEFAVFSDKTIIKNPKYLKKQESKLKREQRKLSRRKNNSINKYKQQIKIRKIYAKIKNSRKDFIHKTTSNIITKYDGVVLENLNISGMLKNHKLAKAISDVSWFEFKRQLEYKTKWNFKHFILIGRFEPTSKKCSNCGYIQEMTLKKRIFNCPICGLHLDRDLNASINIKNLGINTVGHTEINACGDDKIHAHLGRWSSMKQEKECLVN